MRGREGGREKWKGYEEENEGAKRLGHFSHPHLSGERGGLGKVVGESGTVKGLVETFFSSQGPHKVGHSIAYCSPLEGVGIRC